MASCLAKAKIPNHYVAMTTLYGPDEAWFCAGARVGPGQEGDFAQAVNLYRSTVASAKATLPWVTYEIMAGMPGPVFIIFVPHKALAEIDPATGAMAAVENIIFAVSPEMSYPVPEWVTQNPEFWGRKPTAPRDAASPKPGS